MIGGERQQRFSVQVLQIMDATLIWLSFLLAGLLGNPMRDLLGRPELEEDGLAGMMWVVYLTVPLVPLVLERFEFYERPLSKTHGRRFSELLRAVILVGMVIGMASIFGRLGETKRLILAMGGIFTIAAVWVRSDVTSRLLRQHAAQDGKRDAVILAGNQSEIDGFLERIDPDLLRTWRVVARFDLEESRLEDLDRVLKDEPVRRVIFLTGHAKFDRVVRAVELCEVQGVEAMISASFLRTQVARPSFDVMGGQPMLVFRSTPEVSWQLFGKKLIDFFGSLALMIFTLPLWIVAAIGIRLSSPGAPVMFRQERAGLYGRPFWIYKFRTMVPDAEKLLDQIKEAHGNEVDGPAFKLTGDPRIFSFGHFLRKYSIDELPQMINVLRGEMSLVGPRPLPMHEVDAIVNSAHRRRLSVKPGITCRWQISGRSGITDFEEWVKLDVGYIDEWSLWEDFRILMKTVPAVIFGKGAK